MFPARNYIHCRDIKAEVSRVRCELIFGPLLFVVGLRTPSKIPSLPVIVWQQSFPKKSRRGVHHRRETSIMRQATSMARSGGGGMTSRYAWAFGHTLPSSIGLARSFLTPVSSASPRRVAARLGNHEPDLRRYTYISRRKDCKIHLPGVSGRGRM